MYCIVPVSFEKAADNTNTRTTKEVQNFFHTLTLKVLLISELDSSTPDKFLVIPSYMPSFGEKD